MSSIFKSLTRGVNFNTNRFLDDAVKLQVMKEEQNSTTRFQPHFQTNQQLTINKEAKKKKKRKAEEHSPDSDDDELPIFKKSKVQDKDQKQQPVQVQKVSKKQARAEKKKAEDDKIRALRKSHSIYVYGFQAPPPVQEFHEIQGMTEQLLKNIKECGYQVPTPVQMQAIPIMLQGRELLASAPTGSGKSAAFLIPLVLLLGEPSDNGIRAVIVSPTRELAGQIYRECLRLTESTSLRTLNLSKNHAKLKKCDILISTPNSLIHSTVDFTKVQYLIVDECDNLFDQGFQDQLASIYTGCDHAKRAFFSATCSHSVESFCKAHLDNHLSLVVGAKNSAVDLVEQSIIFTGNEAGKLIAIKNLIQKGVQAPVLVFLQSQDRAEQLYSELKYLKVGLIHSSVKNREQVIEDFRSGKLWFLICTGLISRGMDFPAVRTVINYDMPASHVAYIHQIGRTGRAGKTGRAITFYTEEDRFNLRRIAQILKNSDFPIPAYMLKLKKARKDEVRLPKRKDITRGAKSAKSKKSKFKKSTEVKNADGESKQKSDKSKSKPSSSITNGKRLSKPKPGKKKILFKKDKKTKSEIK